MKPISVFTLALCIPVFVAACSSSEPSGTAPDPASAVDASSDAKTADSEQTSDASAENPKRDSGTRADAKIFEEAGPMPPKSCKGEPPSCTDRAEAVCGSVLGCKWAAACGGGLGKNCSQQTDEASCKVSQCTWSGTTCSGLSAFCSDMKTPANCTTHGCTWEGLCNGLPSPCSTLSEADCGKQTGCHFE